MVAHPSDSGGSGTTEALLDSDARPRYQRVANIHVARQAVSVLRDVQLVLPIFAVHAAWGADDDVE
jgi:hypothetical protein